MNVTNKTHYLNVYSQKIKSDNPYDGRVGFWATVTAIDAEHNCVDVRNDQGLVFHSIPVSSKEWVKRIKDSEDNSLKFISGEINLPSIDSRVFIFCPDGTISGSFVLCSGFPGYYGTGNANDDIKSYFKENAKNPTKRKILTQAGWEISEDITTGDLTLYRENATSSETITTKISISDENGVVISSTKPVTIHSNAKSGSTSSFGNSNMTIDYALSQIIKLLANIATTTTVAVSGSTGKIAISDATLLNALTNLQTNWANYYTS